LSESNRCNDVPIVIEFEDARVLRVIICAPDPEEKRAFGVRRNRKDAARCGGVLDTSPLSLELSFRVEQL
jgi:hypothetical protein